MGFVKSRGISKLALTLFAVLFILLAFSIFANAQSLIPCAKERKGCYKNGDGRVSAGTLTPQEFDYYLPERQCIQTGNCDCAGDPESVTKEQDPDNSDEACSCLTASQFDTGGKCCGDDKSDCGKIASDALCSMDLDRTSGNWLRPDELPGDIFYTGCLAAEHFSDGKDWKLCSAQLWKKNFTGHEYLCIGRGEGSIAECCGDGTCNSRTDGKRLSTGDYVNPAEYDNEVTPPDGEGPNSTIGFCKPLLETPRCGDASIDPGCVCGKYERRQKYRGCEPTEQVCVPDYDCVVRTLDPDCMKCTVVSPTTCPVQVDLYRCIYNGTKIPCSTVNDCPSNGYKCKATDTSAIGSFLLSDSITGNAVSPNENKRYYCNSDGKFITDLDSSKTTCENAGFTWTGSKCCGDQPGEYFNDPDGTAGCFNSFALLNGEMLNVSNQSVFSSKGKFFGCQLDAKNFNTINDAYLSLKDSKTSNPLIINVKYCNIEPDTNNQCQFIEKFSAPSDPTATNISFAPIPVPRTQDKAACCQPTKCWNGTACIEDQSSKPFSGPIGNTALRCISGEWKSSKKKFTPDEDGSGYCPQDSQCLLSVSAQSGNQCIESGEFSGDNYCNNGDWISRTGLVALEMIKIKGNADYSLFCDDRQNTLNYIDYAVGNKIAAQILDELGANSFCVLKTQSKTVLGSPIENKNTSINYGIFGVASCANVADDGQFHSCDGSNRLWINKKSNVFIFSTSALSISSASASFDDLIKNPIKSVIDAIKRLLSKPPYDESYLTSIKKFRKLYMMQQSGKSMRGSIEGQDFKNLVIQYENFDTNICLLTDKYQKSHEDIYSGISCTNQGKNYYVISQGSADTLVSPEGVWPDLTSKLRTK